MWKITRTSAASTVLALALVGGGAAAGATPIAAAAAPTPMHISASGGDNTAVDKDGTEGGFTDSVQGTVDSDGDEDARDMTKSEEAIPQEKAPTTFKRR